MKLPGELIDVYDWWYKEKQHWSNDFYDYREGNFFKYFWNAFLHHWLYSLTYLFNINRRFCKHVHKCMDCYVDATVEEFLVERYGKDVFEKYTYDYESEYYDITESSGWWRIKSITVRRKPKNEQNTIQIARLPDEKTTFRRWIW